MSTAVRVSPYMDAKTCAEYLDVSLGTIRKWTYLKEIPHLKHGRVVKYYQPEIDQWMASKKVEVKAPTLSRFQAARERLRSLKSA